MPGLDWRAMETLALFAGALALSLVVHIPAQSAAAFAVEAGLAALWLRWITVQATGRGGRSEFWNRPRQERGV